MRISMYWHNGRSLGHTAEVAKISHALVKDMPNATLVGLSGAYRGLDLLPESMDIVKLPAFVNYDKASGWDMSGRQGMDVKALFQLRSEMSKVLIRHYKPDIFLINHLPYGAENELAPALSNTKSGLRVLTLRGVLFDREKTTREYFSSKHTKWIHDNFDAIFVHVDPNVFMLEEYYDVPIELRDRIQYTGYLANKSSLTKNKAREQLNINSEERIIVASMGGGQGAFDIWKSVITALKTNEKSFDKAIVVTGPYLELNESIELNKLASEIPWLQVIKYVPNMTTWMTASDLFIGAAGSNMLGEILATGCNSIAIPRQVREAEQRIHSALLEQKGILRVCNLEDVLEGKLDKIVNDGLNEAIIPNNNLMLNGASRYADLLSKLSKVRC